MQPNYMSMSGYGYGQGYPGPLALTQPEPIPSWLPAPVAPVQRSFPMASAAATAFNYDTDMAGLMPTSTPLGGTPTNFEISQGWGGTAPAGGSNWFRDSGFLSSRNTDGTMSQGWGGLALGGAQALGSLYMGMKQYGLAKETLANNKAQFERNFAAQRQTTNSALEDRQRARVASNPGAYQSVGDYMNQNEVR